MVVCKYFLQGSCKFGTCCNNEHQINSKYTYTNPNYNENTRPSTSILRQANFGNSQTTQKTIGSTNVDAGTLVKSVESDMIGAEKGGQWLLSCYAPFKEKPAFPGFEEQSPEEIRAGYYEAQKNGTLEQYKQQVQMLLRKNQMMVRALQTQSPEVVTMLQNIYNSPPSSCSGIYGQPPVSQPNNLNPLANNVFARQSNAFEPFKPSNQQTSIFGGHQSSQAQTNIFANAAPVQNKSIFGPSTNIFANSGQQSNPSMFAPQQPSGNMFASPPQASQTPNLFLPPPTNMFAPQNAPEEMVASDIPQEQTNIFVSPQQTPFASSVPQNLFASSNNVSQQTQTNNIFAKPSNYSASIFGGNVNSVKPTKSVHFQPEDTIDESLYSKLEELTTEERKWFEGNDYQINNIPEKPPTYEMCFVK